MITIYLEDRNSVKNAYIAANLPWVRERLQFFINAFKFINRVISVNDLKNANAWEYVTKTSLLKILLKSTKRASFTSHTHYNRLRNPNQVHESYRLNAAIYITKLEGIDDALLTEILVAHPDRLLEIQRDLFNGWDTLVNLKPLLQSIFNYDTLRDHSNYNLKHISTEVRLKSCPYCNIVKISFENEARDPIVSPAVDHFYDKQRNPLLGTSLFNLVPSCTKCNSQLKGDFEFNRDTHLNPHIEGFEEDAVFSAVITVNGTDISYKGDLVVNAPVGSPKYVKIIDAGFSDTSKLGNANVFKLKQSYSVDYSAKIRKIHEICDEETVEYMRTLKAFINRLGGGDLWTYYKKFDVYLDPNKFQEEDLSKFIYDILKEKLEIMGIGV